jgi:hypothetical protein
MTNHTALKSVKPNYVRQAVENILADQKDLILPLLPTEQYHSFLSKFTRPAIHPSLTSFPDSLSTLLAKPTFIQQHLWETMTLEHPISRPKHFNVRDEKSCEAIDIRMRSPEKDSSGLPVFEGWWVAVIVDGYVLAKGRSTVSSEGALVNLFEKVNTLAREWMGDGDGERVT